MLLKDMIVFWRASISFHGPLLGEVHAAAVGYVHLVEVERKNGRLDRLSCEPLIISGVRAPHARLCDDQTGYSAKKWAILSSAL